MSSRIARAEAPPHDANSLYRCITSSSTRTTNRLHLDLAPGSPADRDSEIERVLALCARLVDVGQTGSGSWTVLADPEGNEFCVLRAKQNLIN